MVLSERQFYRERALAFDSIGRALEREPATVSSAETRLALRIESLHDLLAAGHAASVARTADVVLGGGVPHSAVARLLALKGAAYARQGDAEPARQALHEAFERSSGEIAHADVLSARAASAYVDGALDEAASLLRQAVKLTGSEPTLSDPAGVRAYLRHLYWLANVHEETNDAAGAQRLLDLAHGVLLSRAPDDLSMLGAIKTQTACVALCLPGEASRALEELADAESIACRVGSPILYARVESLMAFTALATGPADAVRHARVAVELAQSALGGEELARVLLSSARVLTSCGDAPAALGLIELAKKHCVPGRYIDTIARFRHADALTAVGLHEEASHLAESACAKISSVNRSHYLGSAHLAAARAKAALGKLPEAMEHVDAAMPLLEKSGFLIEVKRANEMAARITGDPVYARRTQEMCRLLNVS
jgi:tetratricopeptide (TPR) repeat protein